MQRLEIIGHLGADAEVKQAQGGSQFVVFRVACSTQFNGQEVTQWYDCTINNLNLGVIPYLKKGTRVFVRGIPSYRIFDSAKYHQKFVGISLFTLEVQLCSDKKEDNGQAAQGQSQGSVGQGVQQNQGQQIQSVQHNQYQAGNDIPQNAPSLGNQPFPPYVPVGEAVQSDLPF